MIILTAIFLANAIAVVLLVGLTLSFHRLMKPAEKAGLPDAELPFVSVIVPARNEELYIERCLRSLASQDYPKLEIIVFDDQSTDATAEIIARVAQEHRSITLVQGREPPPPGWKGKCNALRQAVQHASGEWFFFTDADAQHSPSSLRDGMACALRGKAKFLSLWPRQEVSSFGEKVVMPVVWGMFCWGDPFLTVNNSAWDTAYAAGMYILVERQAYLSVGGHESVKNSLIDDHDLAKTFKYKALPVLIADGKHLYQSRMYTGWKALWNGWTRSLYPVMGYSNLALLIMFLCVNALFVMPFAELLALGTFWAAGSQLENLGALLALVVVQLVAVVIWWLDMAACFQGLGLAYILLVPLGGFILSLLLLNSAYKTWTGGSVEWKDRDLLARIPGERPMPPRRARRSS